ncbi:hypothetical protein PMAYCL1PPCAC_28037, partial [Pristionchus mayeri]
DESQWTLFTDRHNNNVIYINGHIEIPSLGSLPWPASDRICYYLRTNGECIDLASFACVSNHFRRRVKDFMKKPGNRPNIDQIYVEKTEDGGLELTLELILTNLPFYDLHDLDWDRCHRGIDGSTPVLRVSITNANDPVVQQVVVLVSAPINSVVIAGWEGIFTSDDLQLCSQLFRASTIDHLVFPNAMIDEKTAPCILSLAGRAKELSLFLVEHSLEISNAAAFLNQLDSLDLSLNVTDTYSTEFFGLSFDFWRTFLNQKLNSESVEHVDVGALDMSVTHFTKAPIVLSDNEFYELGWKTIHSK